MNKWIKRLLVPVVLVTSSSPLPAAQITVGDFTSPTSVGFGSPNPTAFVTQPLTVGNSTFSTPGGGNLIWWGAANPYNDCIGGCVTNAIFTADTLIVDLSSPYALAGLFVGQATAYSLTVGFYDATNTLLGTVNASGAGDGVSFAGWQSDAAPITSIHITNPVSDNYVISAQSGLFQTSAVPEPATWAMMLIGFGAAGLSLRRKRRLLPASV